MEYIQNIIMKLCFSKSLLSKAIILSLICCSNIVFINCTKDNIEGIADAGKTTVTGSVFGGGYDLENAEVIIRSWEEGEQNEPYSIDTIVFTDKYGQFDFRFKANISRDYQFIASHPKYENTDTEKEIKSGVKNEIFVSLQPFGWIRFNIKNIPPTKTLSYLDINILHGESVRINNLNKDTVFVARGYGDFHNAFVLKWKDETGSEVVKHESIFVSSLETVEYNFEY